MKFEFFQFGKPETLEDLTRELDEVNLKLESIGQTTPKDEREFEQIGKLVKRQRTLREKIAKLKGVEGTAKES